ncbi:MAG TPA: malto-oligosyltrehalose trehalohydrolase [Polyangiaceae bacterium]
MREGARSRRMPVGAECVGAAVDFRVWAPKRRRVEVVLEGGPGAGTAHACVAQPDGYFRQLVSSARAGTLYRFRLDDGPELFPDPASRAQPSGPDGPSEVVDPSAYVWSDAGWEGVPPTLRVIYEMHVGTFTPEGTWAAAMAQLPELASLGISLVEMMPVADFPGRFGWGYDGVNLFAPTRLYGRPDNLRRFVDRAHDLGMGVVLDVVYNHFGPHGNHLAQFSDTYFNEKCPTAWGPAINYDAEGSAGARELIIANARYWIDEYHFDGLRLDATQDIHDASADHVVAALVRSARAAAPRRFTFFVAENEPQRATLVRPPERAGYALDALWNDDLHHAAHVALTGRAEAYYLDYAGSPQELVSAIKRGFLFQGQRSQWQAAGRGSPALDLEPHRFVSYLENHDQVANSAFGTRLHQLASPGRHRALTTLVLLAPSTPMLFQGEELASSAPFVFFADHEPELAAKVREGRGEYLSQFPSIADPDVLARLDPPDDPATFRRCKLDLDERTRHAGTYAFYKDLIALRRRDAVFREPARVDGAVLSPSAFVVRLFGPSPGDDRLIVVNLGGDARMARIPEPLVAPPEGRRWETLFSSEDPRYDGAGTPPHEVDGAWHLLGEASLVLGASPSESS